MPDARFRPAQSGTKNLSEKVMAVQGWRLIVPVEEHRNLPESTNPRKLTLPGLSFIPNKFSFRWVAERRPIIFANEVSFRDDLATKSRCFPQSNESLFRAKQNGRVGQSLHLTRVRQLRSPPHYQGCGH
jgi:hypothetical protein